MVPATTSPISAMCSRSRKSRSTVRRGFTLVEMLVVIGIIILVLGIAGPAITRAWRSGDRARTASMLNAISMALEAYKQDHGDYPRVAGKPYEGAAAQNSTYNGARMLLRALVGPGPGVPKGPADFASIADGAGIAKAGSQVETEPGPGFRVRGAQGKVYGPYIQPQQLKIGHPDSGKNPALSSNQPPGLLAFLDTDLNPILYYPGLGHPDIHRDIGFIADYDNDNPPSGTRPLYNARDNKGAMPLATFSVMMGDGSNEIPKRASNGKIDGKDIAAFEGPFVLWSAGPDGEFGSTTVNLDKTDDVTNFRK
jgi:prepilin-type N-terminal cleavage/methylation domain-containing protein